MERAQGRLLRGPEDDQSDDKSLVTDDTKIDDQKTDDQKTDDQKVDDTKVDEQKTEEQKAAEQKTEEAKVEVVPLTVTDLAVPEGFEIDATQAEEFLKLVNDGEMDPKTKVNALIALHAKTIGEAQEAGSVAFEKMQNDWKDEVKADPDIGGAKLQSTIANVGKLIDEFGNAELKEAFDFTGAGNNIHVIKFLNVIADKLTEGKFFTGGSPSKSDDPDAAAKRMYPSMKG